MTTTYKETRTDIENKDTADLALRGKLVFKFNKSLWNLGTSCFGEIIFQVQILRVVHAAWLNCVNVISKKRSLGRGDCG